MSRPVLTLDKEHPLEVVLLARICLDNFHITDCGPLGDCYQCKATSSDWYHWQSFSESLLSQPSRAQIVPEVFDRQRQRHLETQKERHYDIECAMRRLSEYADYDNYRPEPRAFTRYLHRLMTYQHEERLPTVSVFEAAQRGVEDSWYTFITFGSGAQDFSLYQVWSEAYAHELEAHKQPVPATLDRIKPTYRRHIGDLSSVQ